MRTLISTAIFCILSLAGLPGQAQSPYRLNNLEKQPIPRAEFYRLWRNVALGNCSKALQQKYESPEACRKQVLERAPACATGMMDKTPEKVASFDLSSELARQYLSCTMGAGATP